MSTTSNKKIASNCCGGCAAIILILVLIVAFRWANGVNAPNLTVPPKPVAPSPNAFDTYISATQLLTNVSQIGDALATKPTVSRTLSQKAALVNSNSGALKLLRSGFAQEYYDPSARSINTLYPYYAHFRAMARLLALEGAVRAESGDWNGAAQSSLDCIKLGVNIPRGGPLIGDLVGIACQAIGRRNLWKYLNHLDARHSRQAINQLLAMEKSRVPYADTMQEERYMLMSSLNIMFKTKDGMQSALSQQYGGQQNGGPPAVLYELMYLVYSKDTIANNSKKYMDQLISNARQPYGLHLADPPTPSDPISQVLMPVFSQARLKDVEAATQNGMLSVMIALHAYKLEHGRYPDSLLQLSTSYIALLPDDPFAAKGTFGYHLTGDTFVLYSVGPDGKDDGGKPIDVPSKATNGSPYARYFVDADSKGDIVAGKNIW